MNRPRKISKGSAAFAALLAALLLSAALLSACGSSEDEGPVTLSWFIFNEPSGVLPKVAKQCSNEAGNAYQIEFEYLPSDADSQREQLVRRLGAEDDSIDIIGMDIIWTGEFANAGWIEEWTGRDKAMASKGVFQSMIEAATFEEKLWAAPLWTNTQLLWYREDRVPKPPKTWDEMIRIGERIGANGKVQVQAAFYEGLVVWFNSMVASAGTTIVNPDDPEQMVLEPGPTGEGLAAMAKLANSSVADPSISTSDEDTARLAYEAGGSSFMVNYPFVYPSAQENAPEIAKKTGVARYPRVVPDLPSKPPLGGIELGVSAFSQHKRQAFDAIKCLIQPDKQVQIAKAGGLPPVNEKLYEGKQLDQVYPGFTDLLKQSIDAAEPRPVTPAYQDVSLAIQRSIHPVGDIDPADPAPVVEKVRENVETALKVEGVL